MTWAGNADPLRHMIDAGIHQRRDSDLLGKADPRPWVRPVRRGVIGILERDSRYLMIQRAAGVSKPGTWCFPGGHVEPTETSRRAVIRELAEELGIAIQPLARLGAVRVLDSRHILAVWRVDHVGGDFRLAEKEIADLRWVSVDQIATISPGLPSNAMVLGLLGCHY